MSSTPHAQGTESSGASVDPPWRSWSDLPVFDALFTPRATRIYQDRPVPEADLAKILRAASFAASSGNTQPWDFVVVTDRAIKSQLRAQLEPAFGVRRRTQSAEQLVDGAGRPITGHAAIENIERVSAIVMVFWNPDRGIRFENEYEENPDGTLREVLGQPGGRGASIFPACQNMILAAQALGIQSLFTTFFCLVDRQVKELLHVPPRMFLEAAVFLGHADEKLGRPRRRPLSDVAHLNDWATPWAASEVAAI